MSSGQQTTNTTSIFADKICARRSVAARYAAAAAAAATAYGLPVDCLHRTVAEEEQNGGPASSGPEPIRTITLLAD